MWRLERSHFSSLKGVVLLAYPSLGLSLHAAKSEKREESLVTLGRFGYLIGMRMRYRSRDSLTSKLYSMTSKNGGWGSKIAGRLLI